MDPDPGGQKHTDPTDSESRTTARARRQQEQGDSKSKMTTRAGRQQEQGVTATSRTTARAGDIKSG